MLEFIHGFISLKGIETDLRLAHSPFIANSSLWFCQIFLFAVSIYRRMINHELLLVTLISIKLAGQAPEIYYA